MANVYKITAMDIGEVLYQNIYKYAILKTDDEKKIVSKQLLMYQDMLFKMKEEVKEGSVVAIRNFGSFSLAKRKNGNLYVKFSQAKRLKENIQNELKKKSLTNLMLERKQENNFIEIKEIVQLLILDGKVISMEEIENTRERYKSSELKLKKILINRVLDFFLKVEKLVFEYKLVDINGFGCFFLKNNLLYGLHFKYSSASCQYLFKTKPKINRLIDKLNAKKIEKELPWE